MSKEVEANVTSLWSSGHVTLAVHWLGVRECGVNTAMGGSFDLGRNQLSLFNNLFHSSLVFSSHNRRQYTLREFQ